MTDIALLRHFLAALAYRTQKALRDAPDSYSGFRATGRWPGDLVTLARTEMVGN